MKELIRYGYMTLIVFQILFVIIWYIDFNFLCILNWIGRGDSFHVIRLLSPLIIYGLIKMLYWFADPLSVFFDIILRWLMIFGVCYLFYCLFFI